MSRKSIARAVGGVLAITLLLGSLAGCNLFVGSGKGELIMGLASDIMQRGGMDPALSTSVPNLVVDMNIYDNLVYMNTDGSIKGGLAESWTISPDAKLYTFKLRKGVKFHDGTVLDAAAVKAMFDRIKDPVNKLPAVAYLGPYEKSVAKDANTIEVYFTQPFAAFINNLTMYNFGVPSPAAVAKYGKDFPQNPVGSGPFKFKSAVAGQSITLERNSAYNWPPTGMFQHTGPAHLKTITFKFIPEEVPRMGALETGVCNAVVYLSADGLRRFKADPAKYKITLALVPCAAFGYYLNVTKFPTDDPAVRRAMNFAVDQDTMINTLYGGVTAPAQGIFSQAMMGYSPEVDTMYPFDQAKARQILDDAGWKVGAGGIRVKGGKKLTVNLATLDGQRYQMAAEWIQAALKEVGIDAKLDMMSSSARLEAGKTGSHNGAMMGAQANDPDVLRTLYHSSQIGGDNYARFSDPEIDTWLVQASQNTDRAQRIKLYQDAQKKIFAQAPFLPIWYTTHAFAQLTSVTGLRMDGTGYYPLLYDTQIAK